MFRRCLLLCLLYWCVSPQLANAQKELTFADRKHGELTVRQIFVDRPDLGQVVAMDDPFVDWMEEQFAGRAVGDRLYWDHAAPFQNPAQYLSPTSIRGFIRVSGDPGITSVDRCALFAFTLCSVPNWQTRDRLWADALSGAIDRDEFVSKWARVDWEAKVAAKKILMRFGFAERTSSQTPITSHFLSLEEDYRVYKAKCDVAKDDPANPFVAIGRMYDAMRPPTPPSPEV